MAGALQTFQQLLHGGGLPNLAGTDHHLEQRMIVPDRLFKVVHHRSLEWFHFRGLYLPNGLLVNISHSLSIFTQPLSKHLQLGDAFTDGVMDEVGLFVEVQLGHYAVPVGMDGVDGQVQ